MILNLIAQVCEELGLSAPVLGKSGFISFVLRDDIEVTVRDLEPGASFYSVICKVPEKRKEDLYILLMKANYLGQATGISRIGMSKDEKFLTLSASMPYELTYRAFREFLEDFVNFLLYHRDEIAKFETQNSVV